MFAACCAPLLAGEREAATCEQLMRSRYTAFAVGHVDHLWRTLHPGHEDRARPEAVVREELRRWSARVGYVGLRVLGARSLGEGEGQVLFDARWVDGSRRCGLVELSDFARDGGAWRYLCGVGVELGGFKGKLPYDETIDGFEAWVATRRRV